MARISSDEFAVLIEDAGSADKSDAARVVAEIAGNIRASLSAPYQLKDEARMSTASIGVRIICGENESADELIKQATTAMLQAKGSGRNAISFFEPQNTGIS